ncbi:hypothetical protein LWI28_021248 [Acer negundo]|uniref:CCHC-type domain-containing protein n=1 Tax=Acer negundo TaxID=4023 RepID=A0AAD5ISG6_ACENE|nr:hypothetical protein LWI28_021248 [Acer negundo]
MSKLSNLKFDALKVSGENYMSWVIDAGLYLKSQGLYYTIYDNQANEQDRSTAMVIICHHLHEDLKAQYLTVTEPEDLWRELKDRYDHQQNVTLPIARYKWLNLRFQDHKSVSDYNSDLFRITTMMKLCGEEVSEKEMLEKTFTTFHASNIILQQQYRERRFSKYSELISCLLVAEKNNELLIKNHESHPTGSKAFPEVNANTVGYRGRGRNRGRGYGRGYGRNTNRGRGNGRNPGRNPGRGHGRSSRRGRGYSGPSEYKRKGIRNMPNAKEGVCYRCGCYNHWSNECSTPKHLVELYQASIKEKGKISETHLIENPYPMDITHLNVTDFFEDPKDKLTASIGDGKVHTN